jgi:AcrR family transcriptional regulator
MESPKPDRRVARTRRLLRDALFALILEKGYDAVTIEDITERADLGRTTFYLHYRDKEELLLESIEGLIEDLKQQVMPKNLRDWRLFSPGQPQPLEAVFQHAADNANLYRIILKGQGAPKASQRVANLISETVGEILAQRSEQAGYRERAAVPLDVFAAYFAGALLGFITWWLETRPNYSPQQMSDLFLKLFFLGGFQTLGVAEETP